MVKIPWKRRDKTTNCWIVYKHTTPSGGVYIGITGDPVKKRWRRGNGYNGCIAFKRAIDKYGWENITHEIIFKNLYKYEAEEKEKELIKYYKEKGHCYNLADGGTRDFVSEETKTKMRNNRQGKNAHNYGHSPNSEQRKILSQAIKGIKRSENTKKELKEKHSKKVYQYDKDGNFIGIWSSAVQASKSTHTNLSGLNRCRLYYKSSIKGYIWLDEFINDKTLLKKYYNKEILIPPKINHLCKKVLQLNDDYKIIGLYSSLKKAAKAVNVPDTHIGYSCKEYEKYKKRRIAGGFYWEYLPIESYYPFDSYFFIMQHIKKKQNK